MVKGTDEGTSGHGRGDLVLSSALYLVSRYAVAAAQGETCPKLAVSIQCHLELLAERADMPALVRHTCGLLAEEWRMTLAREADRPCDRSLRSLVRRAIMR